MSTRLALVVAALCCTIPATAVSGAIYHCTRADGKTYATNRPCPMGERSAVAMKTRDRPGETEGVERLKLSPSSRGQYWIETRINEVLKVTFLIDTGASQVLIPQDVLDKLTGMNTVDQGDHLPPRNATLADGSVKKFPALRLRTITLGERRIENVMAGVGGEKAVPLLGTSVLDRLGPWRIDQERGELVLGESARESPATTPPPTPTGKSGGGKTMHECKNMQTEINNRRKQMDDLLQTHKDDSARMEARLQTLREKERQLMETRKNINSGTALAVKYWNNEVDQLTRDQEETMTQLDRHKKTAAERKEQATNQNKTLQTLAGDFNKFCAGVLYQDYSGAWKEFPVYQSHDLR